MKPPEVGLLTSVADSLFQAATGMNVTDAHGGDLSRGLEEVPVLFEALAFHTFQVTIL